MRGVVRHFNIGRGLVAVETDSGFSVFGLLGPPHFAMGDVVSWASPTAGGPTELTNVTRGGAAAVDFRNHWVPPDCVLRELGIGAAGRGRVAGGAGAAAR